MTLNEITYSIREAVKEYTDDSELDDRYIQYLLGLKRSKYLKQKMNNFQKVTDLSVQQTFCVGLEKVDGAECGLDTPCEILLRSDKLIPDPIMLHLKPAILRVAPASKLSQSFNFVDRFKAVYAANSPFPKGVYSFLHDDNRLYLTSAKKGFKLLDCISITGVFEDPIKIAEFSDCCGCTTAAPCFDADTYEYPIPPDLVDIIRADVINELIQHKQTPEDRINNSND